jgi:hypothetical protein
MAEWQKTVPCRYFKIGTCTRSDACPYLHQPEYTEDTEYSTEYDLEDEYEYTNAEQYVNDDVQYGSDDVQYGTTSMGESYPTELQNLTIGVGSLGLDPCVDPNCPEEESCYPAPQELGGAGALYPAPQEVGGAGALYPASPTYILYAPVFHSTCISPGHPVLSPGHPAISPGHSALSPGHPAISPGYPAMSPSHICITEDIPCGQIYPPTPDSSFNSSISASYPSTSACTSNHPSYPLLTPCAPLSDPLTPPRTKTPLVEEAVTTPVIYKNTPECSPSAPLKPLNPEPKEFVPRIPSKDSMPLVTPLSRDTKDIPVFVPRAPSTSGVKDPIPAVSLVSTKFNPDPPRVCAPWGRRAEELDSTG